MLNEKQLRDAAKCPAIGCHECTNYQTESMFCQSEAAQSAIVLADMLKQLEWHSWQSQNCPWCGASEIYEKKHKPYCELAALLNELEGDK